MIKNWIKKIFHAVGLDIIRYSKATEKKPTIDTKVEELTEGFKNDIEVVRAYSMLSQGRLQSLYECVHYCEATNLQGDYVECGVWKGGAVGLMALANKRFGKTPRHLHLFDTFEGIPEPDEAIDGARAVREARQFGAETKGRMVANPQLYENMGRGVGTLELNKELIEGEIGYSPDYLHYHVGFFQDTVPEQASQIKEISILRLDGDWYASTKVCLDYLYDKVASGGFIIIDDYGAYEGCQKAVDEFFAKQPHRTPFMFRVDEELRLMVKP